MPLLLLLAAAAWSQEGQEGVGIKPGINYKEIDPPQPVEVPAGKVEVTEFFWYDCQTCYVLQPLLKDWLAKRGGDVVYHRLPAVVGSHMVYYARVYYAAKQLGVIDRVHLPIFTAIHRYGRRLDDEEALVGFFEEQGVDRTRFLSVFRSSAVAAEVREAKIMSLRDDLQGAPTLVVNGRYRIDPTMVANPEALIEVMDFLVSLEKTRKR